MEDRQKLARSEGGEGIKALVDLRDIIDEVGSEVELATNMAELEMCNFRRWTRETWSKRAVSGGSDPDKLAQRVGETLIRLGRASGALRRAAQDVEHLESLAVSVLVDLWPALTMPASNEGQPQ